MSKELSYIKSNLVLPNVFDTLLFRREQRILHPDTLPTSGLICFCGEQGSGKTLSAVNYAYNVCKAYPRCIVCTNISLSWDLPNEVVPYSGPYDMLKMDNGEFGILFLIDEMHIEFNSLESKGMDVHIFELVSQQRKSCKHIVGTSQVFGRLAKPFREQFKYAVCCDNLFGLIFRQCVYRAYNVATDDDIRTVLRSSAVRFYIPSRVDFERYDTREVVRRLRDNGF